jgi:predicted outer membrane protein
MSELILINAKQASEHQDKVGAITTTDKIFVYDAVLKTDGTFDITSADQKDLKDINESNRKYVKKMLNMAIQEESYERT